jgi:single-stranded DNA-binding protein
MAADNHTTIVGNLVEDPEVRFTQKSASPWPTSGSP